MMKCVIIDNQKKAINTLRKHIKTIEELSLIEVFTDPIEALNFLENNLINLVFLEIKMPYLNGLEFIEILKNKKKSASPNFILTTCFDEYALRGFECGVSDYLLKPINSEQFRISMNRYFNNKLEKIPSDTHENDYFFADMHGKKQKINFKDISLIECSGNYISILGDNNLKVGLYKSMHSMQELVPDKNFMRVHKSYIVSINHIHAIKGNELIMALNGTMINVPIGTTFKKDAFKRLRIN